MGYDEWKTTEPARQRGEYGCDGDWLCSCEPCESDRFAEGAMNRAAEELEAAMRDDYEGEGRVHGGTL